MTSPPIAPPDRPRGRLLLLSGLGLAVLGVVAYAVQLSFRRLTLPWYMPALALLGVVLVVGSLWRKRTVLRVFALVAVGLLVGAELAVLNAMRLPPYAGPVAVGRPFPPFRAVRTDGTPFTRDDLTGQRHLAFVFFRGRW